MARFRGMTIGFGAVAVVVGLAPACGSDDGTGDGTNNLGTSGNSGTSGAAGAAASGTATGGFSGQTTVGQDANIPGFGTAQCSNGKDDDGDGQIDGFDAECTGGLDNDESTFATGIPGDNRDPKWQDCFFDGNSGAGDDGCRYATECLTGDLPQTDNDCQLTQHCIDFCGGYSPNGCDCFGCCTIYTDTSSVDILIGPACSVDKIDDQTACPRCTKSTMCANDCGECELCLGKTVEDLPATCVAKPPPDAGPPPADAAPPPPTYQCQTPGQATCASTADCDAATEYCSQGCCVLAPH
jgi:hypothetical protein